MRACSALMMVLFGAVRVGATPAAEENTNAAPGTNTNSDLDSVCGACEGRGGCVHTSHGSTACNRDVGECGPHSDAVRCMPTKGDCGSCEGGCVIEGDPECHTEWQYCKNEAAIVCPAPKVAPLAAPTNTDLDTDANEDTSTNTNSNTNTHAGPSTNTNSNLDADTETHANTDSNMNTIADHSSSVNTGADTNPNINSDPDSVCRVCEGRGGCVHMRDGWTSCNRDVHECQNDREAAVCTPTVGDCGSCENGCVVTGDSECRTEWSVCGNDAAIVCLAPRPLPSVPADADTDTDTDPTNTGTSTSANSNMNTNADPSTNTNANADLDPDTDTSASTGGNTNTNAHHSTNSEPDSVCAACEGRGGCVHTRHGSTSCNRDVNECRNDPEAVVCVPTEGDCGSCEGGCTVPGSDECSTEWSRCGNEATIVCLAPRVPMPTCTDAEGFHIKNCPDCGCDWLAANRCDAYGGYQGEQRNPATGNWWKGKDACCACHGGIVDTQEPTRAPLLPLPAVAASAGVPDCTDSVGAAIKDCEYCTCAWMAVPGRCAAYGKYTTIIPREGGGKLSAAEACCVCRK